MISELQRVVCTVVKVVSVSVHKFTYEYTFQPRVLDAKRRIYSSIYPRYVFGESALCKYRLPEKIRVGTECWLWLDSDSGYEVSDELPEFSEL